MQTILDRFKVKEIALSPLESTKQMSRITTFSNIYDCNYSSPIKLDNIIFVLLIGKTRLNKNLYRENKPNLLHKTSYQDDKK